MKAEMWGRTALQLGGRLSVKVHTHARVRTPKKRNRYKKAFAKRSFAKFLCTSAKPLDYSAMRSKKKAQKIN